MEMYLCKASYYNMLLHLQLLDIKQFGYCAGTCWENLMGEKKTKLLKTLFSYSWLNCSLFCETESKLNNRNWLEYDYNCSQSLAKN